MPERVCCLIPFVWSSTAGALVSTGILTKSVQGFQNTIKITGKQQKQVNDCWPGGRGGRCRGEKAVHPPRVFWGLLGLWVPRNVCSGRMHRRALVLHDSVCKKPHDQPSPKPAA